MPVADKAAPRRTRMIGADRREEIINVSRSLFAERGYDATSLEDIGNALQISGPAIYRHFKNKHALLVGAMADGDKVAELTLAATEGLDGEEALKALLRGEATVAVRHRETMMIWQRERNRMPTRVRTALLGRRFRLYERFDQILAELRPDLDVIERHELRNILSSIALGSADQASELDDESRIAVMVKAGLALVRSYPKSGQRTTSPQPRGRLPRANRKTSTG